MERLSYGLSYDYQTIHMERKPVALGLYMETISIDP